MKKTPITKLVDLIKDDNELSDGDIKIINKLKREEKKNIIDACNSGVDGVRYFKQKFKQ